MYATQFLRNCVAAKSRSVSPALAATDGATDYFLEMTGIPQLIRRNLLWIAQPTVPCEGAITHNCNVAVRVKGMWPERFAHAVQVQPSVGGGRLPAAGAAGALPLTSCCRQLAAQAGGRAGGRGCSGDGWPGGRGEGGGSAQRRWLALCPQANAAGRSAPLAVARTDHTCPKCIEQRH